MDQEGQRYVREGFSSDEELSLYDMLFSENLSKQETKAAVDNLIRDTLWSELPSCYDEFSISRYRQKIYEYVYTRYKEVA